MKKYMLSELIKDAVDTLLEHGDIPIIIDILTENQSNLFDMCHGLDVYHNKCYITLDMGDLTVDQFKRLIE